MSSKPQDVKILLVEDDEGHADLVKMNLERGGVGNEVLHFGNGRKVVDYLLHNPERMPSEKYVMILDINMPGLDGHQVLMCMKLSERTRNIPIIMLTTAENEDEVERCYELGCNLYMAKPVQYDAFSESIHELGQFIQKAKFPGISLVAA